MARAKCPFSVGDEALLTKEGKDYSGIVESITATPMWLDNSTDPPIDWIARGRRINTTTGQVGKWTFEIVGDQSTQQRGRWRHKTLNEALGLGDEED